jgi:hypothetical protein
VANAGQVALQEIVRRARLHAPDRRLLVDRPGHDEKRNVGSQLAGHRERGHPIEPRQGVVREDDVRAELLQLSQVGIATIDPPRLKGHGRALELVFDELGVHGDIFEDQNSEWVLRHPRNPSTGDGTLPVNRPQVYLENQVKCHRYPR